MKKKLSYKEFLEVVPIDLLEKYEAKIREDGRFYVRGYRHISFPLGDEIEYEDTIDTWEIITGEIWAIFWKKVEMIHFAVLPGF